jgi:hypothetical protein
MHHGIQHSSDASTSLPLEYLLVKSHHESMTNIMHDCCGAMHHLYDVHRLLMRVDLEQSSTMHLIHYMTLL